MLQVVPNEISLFYIKFQSIFKYVLNFLALPL
jgi:hypothetical protein